MIITNKGIDGTYVYECKHCRRSTTVHRPLACEGRPT